MKTILCGAGQYSRDLIGRLGESWYIVLIDPSAQRLTELVNQYPIIYQTVEGDASSPVVLKNAGLSESDFVLALTDDDAVNLAIVRFAREAGVTHILALVHDPDREPDFQETGARTLMPGSMVGRTIHHYLQDPRLNVFSIGGGIGEVVEVDVTRQNWVVGLSVASFENPEWRVAALFREGELIFPEIDTDIREADRLVLLGRRDFFKGVCSLMDCTHHPFPLNYGRGILLLIETQDGEGLSETIAETMYLAPNTRAGHLTVMHPEDHPDIGDRLREWSGRVEIRTCPAGDRPLASIESLCESESIGLFIIRPFEKSFFKSLARPEIIALAHSLPAPLLISRHSHPYKKILVPFNGTRMSVKAVETAIDLAEQLRGEADAVHVREPSFIHGDKDDSPDSIFDQVRELSHVHKTAVGEITLDGNPVRELVKLAESYDLMVIGSTSKEKELLSPHVGELLAEKAAPSVLILTS